MSTASDFSGKSAAKGVLLLNPAQFKKYHKSIPGTVVSLPFQREHLEANLRHKGGFLPILAALLAPIIGGVAGGLIEKEIAGSGIYQHHHHPSPPTLLWHKGSTTGGGPTNKSFAFHVSPDSTSGKGLYLKLWKGSHGQFTSGHGLYLSPYPRVIKGKGLMKLEKNRLPTNYCRNFSTEQKKTLYHLL